MTRTTLFSPCRDYRYRLGIGWGDGPRAVFCLLNPSTADEQRNDPTVERCQRRAQAMGYAGVEIVNLFALRSTDPTALYQHSDPIGDLNNRAILDACTGAGIVICGWGRHGALHGRGARVLDLLRSAKVQPHALKLNADGSPGHPLYIHYKVTPKALP